MSTSVPFSYLNRIFSLLSVHGANEESGRRRLTCRWRNTIKATSELVPEYSVTLHMSCLVEEPIYLVWILSNCIVLIVEIFTLHQVVNMLLSMVSSFPPLPIVSIHHTSSYLTPPSNVVCRISTSPCTRLIPPNPTTNVQAPFSVQPLRPYSSRHTPNFYLSHSTQPVKRTLNAHPLLDLSLHHHLQRL